MINAEAGSGGGGGGSATSRMWAITPDGERIDEDGGGDLTDVPWGSIVVMIGGGGGGGGAAWGQGGQGGVHA